MDVVSLTPAQALGIPVALVGAVFLALGSYLQQHGVAKAHGQPSEPSGTKGSRLDLRQVLALFRRPSWLLGTLLLGLAIAFQLLSLYLAPLTVVQPLGALALVITAILTASISKAKLRRAAIRAIVYCVGGVGLFVTIAAITTTTVPITDTQLGIVAAILAGVLLLLGLAFARYRARLPRLFYVVAGGILFGFVATLAKALITRIQTIFHDGFRLTPADLLAIACLAGLAAAAILGSYFVQTAYSSGSPELVVAGLTVIDPLVGVTIGIAVLGEATSVPLWAAPVFALSGAIAVYGVIRLSRQNIQPRPHHTGTPRPGR